MSKFLVCLYSNILVSIFVVANILMSDIWHIFNFSVVKIKFNIIIIHRLRSRRPQGFSMHDDHQQMRQSAVLALLLHYPQAIFVHN